MYTVPFTEYNLPGLSLTASLRSLAREIAHGVFKSELIMLNEPKQCAICDDIFMPIYPQFTRKVYTEKCVLHLCPICTLLCANVVKPLEIPESNYTITTSELCIRVNKNSPRARACAFFASLRFFGVAACTHIPEPDYRALCLLCHRLISSSSIKVTMNDHETIICDRCVSKSNRALIVIYKKSSIIREILRNMVDIPIHIVDAIVAVGLV